MTSGANEAGAISTLGAGETGQNSLINAQNGGVPSLISYPARPIQGGKLDRAPKKIGLWYAQPKYNGWRAVVHCPTGAMWSRRRAVIRQTVTTCGSGSVSGCRGELRGRSSPCCFAREKGCRGDPGFAAVADGCSGGSRSECGSGEVKHLPQLRAARAVVGVGGHEVRHVLPPLLANLG